MPTTLIQSNEPRSMGHIRHRKDDPSTSLEVSEFFSDTIQGEGISTGISSTFLRLKGCTLDCVWCDTAAVWREGDRYTFFELFGLMDSIGLPTRLKKGQHLILTGGSPMKQQMSLIEFIKAFIERYGFKPFIEVENEAVLMPLSEFDELVDQYNNSPKLANSGMKERARIKPLVLSHMGSLKNSWFKFVVESEEDWQEIQNTFIDTNFIKKDQVIIMPQGQNQEELAISRPIAADMAIRHGVRFCDRLHITIWDKKTGV